MCSVPDSPKLKPFRFGKPRDIGCRAKPSAQLQSFLHFTQIAVFVPRMTVYLIVAVVWFSLELPIHVGEPQGHEP